jgi:hypothetical protein
VYKEILIFLSKTSILSDIRFTFLERSYSLKLGTEISFPLMQDWPLPPLYYPTLELDQSVNFEPEILQLFLNAAQSPLNSDKLDILKQIIKEQPDITEIVIGRDYCECVLEHNPELIQSLLQQHRMFCQRALLKRSTDIQTMEIMKQLILNNVVCNEFVYIYVDQCVTTCELQQETTNRDRIARMVLLNSIRPVCF